MDALQNLYLALGELAYSVAMADNGIQEAERKKLHQIVEKEVKNHNPDFDIAEIIFRILEKDRMSLEDAYDWAIGEMKKNSHALTPVMKKDFVSAIKKVAEAYLPVEESEKALIERFEKDVKAIGK